ncbi:hypothetical protein CFC21_052173 [Triticum aestivum]|uniref:Uncharacterized protein n=3 Tax=Triticum TaxID=4564 RepID=A0A9R0S8Q6_TRITD|nr:hypothetical protein CFC21_052173 [Triticum aestivum]VAH90790.1 unnamed protein product [Triticum turgidum subsp. durum]
MAKATRRVDEVADRGAVVDPMVGVASEQGEAEARPPYPGWLDGDARPLGLGGSARPRTEIEAETSGYVGGSRLWCQGRGVGEAAWPGWLGDNLVRATRASLEGWRPAAPVGRRRWQVAWRGVDGGRGDWAQQR